MFLIGKNLSFIKLLKDNYYYIQLFFADQWNEKLEGFGRQKALFIEHYLKNDYDCVQIFFTSWRNEEIICFWLVKISHC